MRLEALNHSQLLQELERLTSEIPRAQETAQTLGTDEGVERFRYSQSSGLELPLLIRRVGRIRQRIVSGIVPALERRQQQVQGLIENYPRRLAQAEGALDTIRQGVDTIYTQEELTLAEGAFRSASAEFKPLEEIKDEVTGPAIFTPTPEPFKQLFLPAEGDRAIITVIYGEGEENRISRVAKLTPNESMVLMVLARAAVLEQRRLRPKELAQRAFNKTPTEVGLNQLVAGLRGEVNAEEIFVDSSGATRGPAVEYGIAEDVHIKSEELQRKKEEAEGLNKRGERLSKLRSLVVRRKGAIMAALFDQLAANVNEVVTVESTEAIFQSAKIIRGRIADIVIDGHKYEVKTVYASKERGLGYSLIEKVIPAPEKKEEEAVSEEVGLVVPPGDYEVPVPGKPSPTTEQIQAHLRQMRVRLENGEKGRDPYADIRRVDSEIEDFALQAAYAFSSAGKTDFSPQDIDRIARVPDQNVEKKVRDRVVAASRWEGHHPWLSPLATVELVLREKFGHNLTLDQERQLVKLAEAYIGEARYLLQQERNSLSAK